MGAKAGERDPLPPGVLLGVAADQDHHQGDNGRGHEQQHGAREVAGEDVGGDQQWDESAQRYLRQVASEVRLQPLDTLGRGRGELA